MRPIYLKMSAFGPFLHEEKIDFDRLSQNGLFLITGQTGSGKTTIFDAITFALYGEASGSNRDVKTLRSDLAKDEETYVELTFMVKNAIYKVIRFPSYFKEGRKTALPAKADLVLPDGKIISGPKEVSAKILEILGLEVNQFKQIAMIAQGEFTKLLFASSDDKEKIFRKIFNTFKYQDFEDELKNQTKQLEEKVKQASIQMKSLMNSISFEFSGSISEYLEALKREVNTLQQTYTTLSVETDRLSKQVKEMEASLTEGKNHNELVEKKQQLKNQLHILEDRKQEYISLEELIKWIEKASELVPYENELKQIKERVISENMQLEALKNQLASYADDFEHIEKEYSTLPELRQKEKDMLLQAENYQQQFNNRQKLNDLLKQKEQIQYQTKRANSDIELLNTNLDTLTKQKKECNEIIESCKEKIATENEVRFKLEALTKQINAFHQVVNEKRNLVQLEEIHGSYAKDYTLLDDLVRNDEQIYSEHQSMFFKMQAGILASTLEEGRPCPVCGSIHHPQLATINNTSITSDTLEKEKNDIETKKRKRDNLYQQVLKANQAIIECKNRIGEIIKANELENTNTKELNQQYDTYIKECGTIEMSKKQLFQYSNAISQLEAKEKQIQASLEEYSTYLQQLSSEIGRIEGSIQSIGTIDERLDDLIITLQKEYKKIKESIAIIEEKYHRMNQYQAKMNGQIHQLEESLASNNQLLIDKNDSWKERLAIFNSKEEYDQYKQQIRFLHQHRTAIQNYQLEVERVSGAIQAIQLKQEDFLDLSFLLKQLEEYSTIYENKLAQKEKHSIVLNSYLKVYDSMSIIHKRNGDDVKKYNLFFELYSVTKGDNPQKLSFERYILSAYFEQIILLANVRFKEMTNARYALVRKETKSRSQSGLDLQVKDYQSGTIREITTLSGGESFKAALSLALGLSDMIQQVSGGIELNTLFIDEGFGSLDQESLDQAIKVLMTLNESNKMIGIISHVTELKQRIDNRLNVMKDQKGSYIEVK